MGIFSSRLMFGMLEKAEVPEMPALRSVLLFERITPPKCGCELIGRRHREGGEEGGAILNELARAFKVSCYGGLFNSTALVKQSLQPTK